METENQQLAIRELQSVYVPLVALRAALMCASDEQTRYYLNGVYVHSTEAEYRVVATDGHRLLVYSTPIPSKRGVVIEAPPWMAQGVIISREGLKDRLAFLDKVATAEIELAYQIGAPYLRMSDVAQTCILKVRTLDGLYSDYQRVLDEMKVFEARAINEMTSITYDATYLKGVGEIAKMLDSKSVRVFGNEGNQPNVITFPDCPQAVLVLMPMRTSTVERLGPGAARVLSGAVSGTVAALRAHRTRWARVAEDPTSSKRAKTEAEAKVADYDRRITALVTNAEEPALPPPPNPYDVWIDAVQAGLEAAGEGERWGVSFHGVVVDNEYFFEALNHGFRDAITPDQMVDEILKPVSYAMNDALQPEQPEPVASVPSEEDADGRRVLRVSQESNRLAVYRFKLKPGERRKELAKFCADLNAVLSAENAGLTLGQLADGVPVDDWFDTGLTPEDAAARCRDWRRIGSVLPPDEMLPGEENKPVGLLQSVLRAAVKPVEPDAEKPAEEQPAKEPIPTNPVLYLQALNAALVRLGGTKLSGSKNVINRRIRGMMNAGLSPHAAAAASLGHDDAQPAAE